MRSRGLTATFGGSLGPPSVLGSGQRPGMLPLAPMVFWDLLSLRFPHVPEGTPGVGIRSVATSPARLSPARLRLLVAPGPHRLPVPHWQAPADPANALLPRGQ